MKLQNLTVIFIIIMLPIILVLSLYITNSIKTVRYQTLYDEGLLTSAHDAIYAFEKNSLNQDLSQNPEVKRSIVKSSVDQFKTSLANTYGISNYSSEEIEEYIPAIVFCMHDGFYLYSPSGLYDSGSGKVEDYTHNLKNYVYYSETLEGAGAGDTDITIMYSLDNYITVCGDFEGDVEDGHDVGYTIKKGYLSVIDLSNDAQESGIKYRGIDIVTETIDGNTNSDGINYYGESYAFTHWFLNTVKMGEKASYLNISETNDPEDENSAFVQHKREIIREKIQGVLNSTIKAYSDRIWGKNYKMPKLSEDEWNKIYSNISMIGFFQGKDIGLTEYNGYCVVNSTNSVEYVNPNLMYFTDISGYYHDIRCSKCNGIAEGKLNGYRIGSFESRKEVVDKEVTDADGNKSIHSELEYLYSHDELGCYDCINGSLNSNLTIYDYVKDNSGTANDSIKTAYWTSLGRERFRANEVTPVDITINIRFDPNGGTDAGNKLAPYNQNIYAYGQEVIFPNSSASPTREGYEFYGWSESRSELGKLEDETILARFNKTYYASWKPELRDVTFDWKYNGVVETQQQPYESTVNFSVTHLSDREHYYFAGWSKDDYTEGVDTPSILTEMDKANEKVKLEGNKYYAVWKQTEYTIKFMRNYDASDTTEIARYTKYYNDIIPFPEAPTRSGYVFMGWSTNPDTLNKVEGEIRVQDDVTLYACWGHKITFDYNDSIGNKQEKTFEHGQKIEFPESPAREGHTFSGWYTDNSGNNKVEGDQFATDNKTYYAGWTINKYNIKFEIGEDATGIEPKTKYDREYYYLEPIVFPTEIPTKEGYTFEGWSTTSGATEGIINPTATAKEDVTYYACWKVKTYTIKFNLNGGTGINVEDYNDEYEYNTVIEFPSQQPTRTGYNFKGWKREDNSVVTNTSNERATRNMTYTAIWDPIMCTITLKPGNGNSDTNITAAYDSVVTFPNNITKTGHILRGWSTDQNAETGNMSAIVKGNATYYALWSKQKYTITFYIYNPREGYTDPYVTQQTYGDNIKTPDNTIIGTKEGHNFGGWKLNNSGNVLTKEQVESARVPDNHTTTYHGVWVPKEYDVIFYHNDTFHGNAENVTTIRQTYGNNVEFPNPNPTQTGHIFKGWCKERNGNVIQGTPTVQASDVPGKENLNKYYAKWQIEKYTIIFNYNGGTHKETGSTGQEVRQNVVYYTMLEFPELNPPIGYKFGGWKEDGIRIDHNNERATKATTYVAIWEKDTFPIVYYKNYPNKGSSSGTYGGMTPFEAELDQVIQISTIRPKPPEDRGEGLGLGVANSGKKYKFIGWNTNPNATTGITSVTVTQSLLASKQISLYAIWEERYYIKFDNNGGTGGNASSFSGYYDKGATIAFPTSNPNRTNWWFRGWSTNQNATSPMASTSGIRANSDVTYYAVWTPTPAPIAGNQTVTISAVSTSGDLGGLFGSSSLRYNMTVTINQALATNVQSYTITIPNVGTRTINGATGSTTFTNVWMETPLRFRRY